MKREVARSKKTGRFATRGALKYRPSLTATEEIEVAEHEVTIYRNKRTGRIVKASSARRHPDRYEGSTVRRGKPTPLENAPSLKGDKTMSDLVAEQRRGADD
jgi:hypothetical protein